MDTKDKRFVMKLIDGMAKIQKAILDIEDLANEYEGQPEMAREYEAVRKCLDIIKKRMGGGDDKSES